MVAVASQYRLSDKNKITPAEAVEDARDVILWMRKNSEKLKIDRNKIAAYGWSAGAHLAACAAVFPKSDFIEKIDSIPDALVLVSPALSLVESDYFINLMKIRSGAGDLSPAEHVKEGMPPSIIVVGRTDTVTPVRESELFHKNMLKNGNQSLLFIYEGVGHLFTPSNIPDDGWPKPDKKIRALAYEQIDLFLSQLNFLN